MPASAYAYTVLSEDAASVTRIVKIAPPVNTWTGSAAIGGQQID